MNLLKVVHQKGTERDNEHLRINIINQCYKLNMLKSLQQKTKL